MPNRRRFGLFVPEGQLEQHLGGPRLVAAHHGIHQFHESLAGVAVHGTHHAEIKQADHVVGQDEKIAGVWVGMEEAMIENLGQQDVGTAAGDQLAIVALLVQPVQQGNLDTVHEFGGQHAFGGLLPAHLGDVNRLVVQKGTGHPFHAGGFQGIVHLLFDGSGKLFDDLDRPVVGNLFDVALGQGSQVEHDLQIHLHQLADPRPLNLDGHILTVFESGAVDLPDGG